MVKGKGGKPVGLPRQEFFARRGGETLITPGKKLAKGKGGKAPAKSRTPKAKAPKPAPPPAPAPVASTPPPAEA